MKINPIKQRAYKVLYIDRFDRKFSVASEVRRAGFGLEYKEGIINKPKVGRLFVFKSFLDARLYVGGDMDQNEIWEVEAFGAREQPKMISASVFYPYYYKDTGDFNILKGLWEAHTDYVDSFKGTLTCQSLRLRRLVDTKSYLD